MYIYLNKDEILRLKLEFLMEPGGALLFSGIFYVAMIDYIVDANGVLYYSKIEGV